MKRVSDTQVKTPSGTTKTEEILDDISVLVGQISKAEDLCVSNLETISKTLDSRLLEAIVHNTEALVEFSFTQSNMLMGIAGYLLGDKGINPTANVSSLLGKIKNTEPLFISHTECLKELSYLFDSLVSTIKATQIVDPSIQSSIHTGAAESSGIESTLNIVLKGIDNGNFDSLIELVNILEKTDSVKNITVLQSIEDLIILLNRIGYMANDELEDKLYMFKEDILPYIYSTDESDIVSKIANIDFTKFSSNTVKRIAQFEMTVDSLGIVLAKISKMVPRMVLINKMKDHIFASIDVLNNITGNNSENSLLSFVNSIAVINKKSRSIKTFGSLMSILVDIFKDLSKVGMFASLCIAVSGPIEGAIDKLNLITAQISKKLKVTDIKSSQEIVHSYKLLLEDIKSIFGDVIKVSIISILIGKGKAIGSAIKKLNNILTIIGEINVENIDNNLVTLDKYRDLMKDLLSVFGIIALLGIASVPALMGGLLLSSAIYTITIILDGAIKSIHKFVSNKDTKQSIESMKTVITSISLLMIFASIMGGIVIGYWLNILAFLGMFTAFALLVLGTVTFIGKWVNKWGAKGGVEALSELSSIIVACTFCMLAGALFMMIPNISSYIFNFGWLFTAFVVVLLGAFLLVSLISGKRMQAQIDGFKNIVITCAGVLMVGALFMMIPNMWKRVIEFGSLLWAFTNIMLLTFLSISKIGGRKIRAQMDEFRKLIVTCASVLIIGALFMMIPAYRENAWIFALTLGAFVVSMVLTLTIYSKYAKGAKLAALSLMLFTMVTAATLMYGANFIAENGRENIIAFAIIVVAYTFLMTLAMILLTRAAKNIVTGTLCMIALVGVTYLMGFALENIAEAYKIFESPGEAFICLGWVAAVLVTFTGVIFGLAALMGTGVGAVLFAAGVAALAALGGAVWAVGEAMKSISDGIKSIKALSKDEDTINVDNITKLIGSIKDIAEKFDVLDNIPIKTIKRSSKIVKMISQSISSISEVVKDTASLKIPIYNEAGAISGYRQLTPEDFTLVSDNVGTIVTSLAGALGDTYDKNPELFKGNKAKKVIKAVKGISDILDNIAGGIVALANLEIPKYNEDGTLAGGTTKLEMTTIKGLGENVNMIVTSFCGSLSKVYNENKELFTGFKSTKVLKALKDVSDVINKFTDAIVKFANAEYPEYDENGNPTGNKVHINDTIIAQMKGSIETLITAVLGSISEIYAKPETQALFTGKNLKNATDAIKDVSAIIGGLGKDIVDLAGLYIKDENGNVVQMDSTHFAKAKQNLKDILTCILGGVDDLSKDDNFKKFTESGGIFGANNWDVPTNIKNNLDKVKPLITSAIENINSINEAVKLLTPAEGETGTGKTWADLLSAIFDPLNSFKVEDEDTAKKKKESIKKSLENARSIINEINRLDEGKADKFIKLSQELKDLSLNVGDMSGLIEALNGKINETLNTVSQRLIESTTALQKSDEAHEKRNRIIKENTAELKKVLETPMKVKVVTNDETSTDTTFGTSNIGSGSVASVSSSGSTTVNTGTPTTQTNNVNTNNPNNSNVSNRNNVIDNSTLTSIAGNTADILLALRELLQKQ